MNDAHRDINDTPVGNKVSGGENAFLWKKIEWLRKNSACFKTFIYIMCSDGIIYIFHEGYICTGHRAVILFILPKSVFIHFVYYESNYYEEQTKI